jgi:hypothetical protein
MTSNAFIAGSVYAQGSVSLSSSPQVGTDIVSGGSITLISNPVVNGDIRSATGSISLSGGHVYGNAQAAGSITISSGQIDGTKTPNSPSAPPPSQTFPTYTFDAADWTGYSVQTMSDCAAAKTFVQSITSGNWVVRIPSSCQFSMSGSDTVTLHGNLAIVSDGGMSMASTSAFVSDSGSHDLFLLVGLGKVAPCDFSMSSSTTIASSIDVVIYTPCTASMSAFTAVMTGQIIAKTVNFSSNATLTSKYIAVPGSGLPGFKEELIYLREVV